MEVASPNAETGHSDRIWQTSSVILSPTPSSMLTYHSTFLIVSLLWHDVLYKPVSKALVLYQLHCVVLTNFSTMSTQSMMVLGLGWFKSSLFNADLPTLLPHHPYLCILPMLTKTPFRTSISHPTKNTNAQALGYPPPKAKRPPSPRHERV